jgi:hypothetical protein
VAAFERKIMTTTSITRGPIRGAGLLLAALASLALPCLAQTQTEGYDPLRQITAQQARANLMILLDITGSMAGDVNGVSVGVDSVGAPSWSSSGSGTGCTGNKYKVWTYTFGGMTLPSRMATVKNALGNSVNLVTGWTAPGSWPALPAIGWTGTSSITTSPTATTWTWVGTWPSCLANPGDPFTTAAAEAAGTLQVFPAQDLVGKNADKINWGLMTFQTSGGTTCSYASTVLRAAIISGDTGDASALQPFLKLYANGGLNASGSTSTRKGLQDAQTQLQTTFTADPKKACNRPYGVILVTDGESNACNPSDSTWTTCPSTYTLYPAGISESIWTTGLTSGTATAKPRVWTIGISPEVGPCELDYTAYKGRSDANSPNKDAGFATAKDPYLPEGTPGTYNTAHGHYAYFATDALSIGKAFAAIVAGTAAGDYTTSAPVAGAGAGASNIVTLPSTEFPNWQGHFYAYDSGVTKAAYDADNTKCYQWLTSCYGGNPTDNSTNPCIPCLKWDAGYLLTEPKTTAASRKIYTWNPASGNALVEVTATNLSTLQAIASGLTAAHVDFIRGNDGAGSPRPWRLGPMINSTPALIAAPLDYTQNTVTMLHKQFRIDQGSRTPVLWVGSNDGMLHGFRLLDGYEQVALLPPSLLGSQMTLYDNYKNQGGSATGQLPDTTTHVYGVANSLRFSDVYFPKTGSMPATFKTVGFLALGPGGAELTAIDLTHPSLGDFGYGFGDPSNLPVQILWRKTNGSGANQLPGLFDSWSLPALAPVAVDTYRLVVGGGFNKAMTQAVQTATTNNTFVDPIYYVLNPVDGSVIGTKTMTSTKGVASPPTLVGNQAFADSVLLSTATKFYQEDNLADLGIQADLNGRIWFASGGSNFPNSAIGIDATAKAGTNQQPIYYPPAASGYGPGGSGCDVFAFASGTLYERSTSVTGPNIGTAPAFEPSLYVAASLKPSTAGSPPSVSASNIIRLKINSLLAPTCPAPCVAQVTAPPYLLVPRSGKGMSKAFFLVYDPKNGCNGFSYIVEVDVPNNASCTLTPSTVTTVVYGGGVGAASGFTITADKVMIAKSGIGAGAKGSISTVPNVTSTSGGTMSLVPQWWRELK